VARERGHVRRDSDDRHVDPPRHMQRSVRRLGAVGRAVRVDPDRINSVLPRNARNDRRGAGAFRTDR